MQINEFYEQLLSLPDLGIEEVMVTEKRIEIHCHSTQGSSQCPQCLSYSGQVNQCYRRQVRDLDISGRQVWLKLSVRQFVCPGCNRFYTETFSWVEPGKSYTNRQARWIFELCAKQPFTQVGALVDLSHKTVERLYFEQARQAADLAARYAQVRRLGIDEIAHQKGSNSYCCVLTDLERGIQLDLLEDRKKDTLLAHFKQLGPVFCEQIQEVSCDMWEPYILVAKACFPQARIVIDRFHVVKALNQCLDNYRKDLRKLHPQQSVFKDLKWLLFKRQDALSDDQKALLQKAFAHSVVLEEIVSLRNRFHAIMDLARGSQWTQQQFDYWLEDAGLLGIAQLQPFVKTLQNWKEYIANFTHNLTTNAVTEGCNNLIRYLKRISFGIPNFENLRWRVLVNSC